MENDITMTTSTLRHTSSGKWHNNDYIHIKIHSSGKWHNNDYIHIKIHSSGKWHNNDYIHIKIHSSGKWHNNDYKQFKWQQAVQEKLTLPTHGCTHGKGTENLLAVQGFKQMGLQGSFKCNGWLNVSIFTRQRILELSSPNCSTRAIQKSLS